MLFARRARCRPREDVRVFESSWETTPPLAVYRVQEVPAQRAARPHRGEGRGAGEGVGGPGAGGQAALCPQDALQEEYSRTGTFPGTPMVPPRRPWTLINWLFWASLLLYPFFRFLVNMVSSGSSLTLASFVLVFFVGESGASGAWAGGEHLREGQGGGGHHAACGDKARLQIPQVDRQKLEPGPETPAWRASARAPPPHAHAPLAPASPAGGQGPGTRDELRPPLPGLCSSARKLFPGS